MNNKDNDFYELFTELGLSVIKTEKFKWFGDYSVEACSADFCVKGVSDKSVLSFEFRNITEPDDWFIAEVVMSLVLNEQIIEAPFIKQVKFIKEHISDLSALFNVNNYYCTKARLEELVVLRGRILFQQD